MQNTISAPYTGASVFFHVPTQTTLGLDNYRKTVRFFFFSVFHQPEATGVLVQRLAAIKKWKKWENADQIKHDNNARLHWRMRCAALHCAALHCTAAGAFGIIFPLSCLQRSLLVYRDVQNTVV